MTAVWWRVTLAARAEDTDAIAAAVINATGNGVEEIAGGAVCTTLDSEPAARDLVQSLGARFPGLVATCTETAPVDWSIRWRDGIVSRRFGRLVLTPSWLPVSETPPDVVISIDPESAFGSGEHGSTRGALALLERHVRAGDRMLDLGSGSGILAIAAARLGAASAIGIEVDDEALPVAEANARRNLVGGAVAFVAGDAGELAALAGPAEVICSNILRSVNATLLPQITAALAPGGLAIFAGMEEAEAALFEPVLAAGQFTIVDVVRDAGWWSVAARRG